MVMDDRVHQSFATVGMGRGNLYGCGGYAVGGPILILAFIREICATASRGFMTFIQVKYCRHTQPTDLRGEGPGCVMQSGRLICHQIHH